MKFPKGRLVTIILNRVQEIHDIKESKDKKIAELEAVIKSYKEKDEFREKYQGVGSNDNPNDGLFSFTNKKGD